MAVWFSLNHGSEFSNVGIIFRDSFQDNFRAEFEDCFMAEFIAVNDILEICYKLIGFEKWARRPTR